VVSKRGKKRDSLLGRGCKKNYEGGGGLGGTSTVENSWGRISSSKGEMLQKKRKVPRREELRKASSGRPKVGAILKIPTKKREGEDIQEGK